MNEREAVDELLNKQTGRSVSRLPKIHSNDVCFISKVDHVVLHSVYFDILCSSVSNVNCSQSWRPTVCALAGTESLSANPVC